MDIIVVNSSDVWVRDNNEGKISKGLDPVCEAYGKEGEGEIRGGVESVCGEGWAAVTGVDSTKSAAVGARNTVTRYRPNQIRQSQRMEWL